MIERESEREESMLTYVCDYIWSESACMCTWLWFIKLFLGDNKWRCTTHFSLVFVLLCLSEHAEAYIMCNFALWWINQGLFRYSANWAALTTISKFNQVQLQTVECYCGAVQATGNKHFSKHTGFRKSSVTHNIVNPVRVSWQKVLENQSKERDFNWQQIINSIWCT